MADNSRLGLKPGQTVIETEGFQTQESAQSQCDSVGCERGELATVRGHKTASGRDGRFRSAKHTRQSAAANDQVRGCISLTSVTLVYGPYLREILKSRRRSREGCLPDRQSIPCGGPSAGQSVDPR